MLKRTAITLLALYGAVGLAGTVMDKLGLLEDK